MRCRLPSGPTIEDTPLMADIDPFKREECPPEAPAPGAEPARRPLLWPFVLLAVLLVLGSGAIELFWPLPPS